MCLLTEDNLETAEDGTVWIRSSRKKTKVEYEIPLLELPLRIIEKHPLDNFKNEEITKKREK